MGDLVRSQRRAVLSIDAVKAKRPSGLKLAALIPPIWPVNVWLVTGDLVRSQRRAVLSWDPVRAKRLSGLKATDLIALYDLLIPGW